jgi:methylthioribose-1-phosphate isomerase
MSTSNQTSNAIPAVVIWENNRLRLLDQTLLPVEERLIDIPDVATLENAILRLAVRGAPAIGCAAAFGVILCARETSGDVSSKEWQTSFDQRCHHLAETRPTAVNLRWAVERCQQLAHQLLAEKSSLATLLTALEKEAVAILDEDRRMCTMIGHYGAALFYGKSAITVMTHCNAGALATGGSGTALAVIYAAQAAGIKVKVFADETRPLLQGARLTAWELDRAGVDVTVICDNMAAAVMRAEKPDACIVGADRIAANGDTANKIGTYGLAILAKHHGVPFYVAAPYSTFDLKLASGAGIPIEERKRSEVAEPYGKLSVPPNAKVFNPAFDVTPAELITAIITERGVLRAPYRDLKF